MTTGFYMHGTTKKTTKTTTKTTTPLGPAIFLAGPYSRLHPLVPAYTQGLTTAYSRAMMRALRGLRSAWDYQSRPMCIQSLLMAPLCLLCLFVVFFCVRIRVIVVWCV